MQVVLLFVIVIALCFLLGSIGHHQEIKSAGGIRNKFNDIFTYIYTIPNTYIVSESDSVIRMQTDDDIVILDWVLTYEYSYCRIRCNVSYSDGTSSSGKPLDTSSQGYWDYFIDKFLEEHKISRK